jgi:precorrin-6A/cobalt-precorrin-6A reductase
MRILLLGGTSDATALAARLSAAGFDAVFSYAGRVSKPTPQPLPTRIGGFGGAEGLEAYLRAERITHVVDATHSFAANMSRNAVEACARAGVKLVALERAPWAPQPGDDWHSAADIAGAIAALPEHGARIFLATGRQSVADFAAKPANFYLLRYIEPPASIPLPDYVGLAGRGPFTVEGDTALMHEHRITHLVAKNAGGAAASAKLEAARSLRLPVIMIERPAVPERLRLETPDAVMGWLAHDAS